MCRAFIQYEMYWYKASPIAVCQCPSGFNGLFCETQESKPTNTGLVVAIILIVGSILALFAARKKVKTFLKIWSWKLDFWLVSFLIYKEIKNKRQSSGVYAFIFLTNQEWELFFLNFCKKGNSPHEIQGVF